ncbi:sensor histidine kinase [Roseivivax sp. CAU 1753]
METYAVLIVDDDDGDRKLIKRLLRKAGCDANVEEARTTSEVSDIRTEHLDAVFLDYLLPGASGLNVLQTVKTRWPQAAIFMITGQGDEELAKNAIRSGASDYIPKAAITSSTLGCMMVNGVGAARAQWKLDEQRRDLATFSEVLVHDFKAPIRAVSFLVEQIEDDIDCGDMDEVRESLRLLKNSSRNMLETIKSLSDHIRFDREETASDIAATDLMDRALGALSQEVLETGARIDLDISNGSERIFCRAPQIAQVLQNLIANAIKFSGQEAAHITVSLKKTMTGHSFEVRDRGIGIEKSQLERIFEPFKRAPGTNCIAGTGLGLATCKKIVLRHDGRIWCRSEPGQGTSMCFELPLQDGAKTIDLSLVG